MTRSIQRSVCPYDCPDACGLLVETEDGKAVKVSGDPEHPFTQGALCAKMLHYERTVHSPARLTTPLLRTGQKGQGQFRPVDWDTAIEVIVRRWQEIIAAYGAEAILPFSYAGTMGLVQRNAGHPFFHRLGASRLVRTICSPAKDYGWRAVMGETLAPHPAEVQDSDLVILWGSDAAATNIHLLRQVQAAKRRGAAVWVINTYEVPTCAAADQIYLVRPGTDGCLALAMMHVLVRDGLVDEAFVREHVQGFAAFASQVLPAYTPEMAAAVTGLTAADIAAMARAYARARAPFISVGSGLSRYGNGAMTVRTITCLPALVGAWAKPGGGLLTGVATGQAFPLSRLTREDFLTAPTRTINMNQLGTALRQLSDPPIMSLYVYSANPAAVVPDQNQVLAGLAREDLFTVVHERFMTDTALYADVVLPATTSLEHSDIYRSYGHYCVQRVRPVIAPVGQARANWDVFRLLAAAMGWNEPFFRHTADELIDLLLTPPTPWLAALDRAQLEEGRPVELPLPPGYKMNFATPSGRIELYNPGEAEPYPRYLPPYGDDAPLWLVTAPSLYSLNSSFNERPELVEMRRGMHLKMNPLDARARGLADGARVVAFNRRGEVAFVLRLTTAVPPGVVVAEGVWPRRLAPGDRTVNALTSQRLTDRADGSTFYDTKVDVRQG